MVPIGLANDVSLEFCSVVVIQRPAHVVRRTLHETRLLDADGVSCVVPGVQLVSNTQRVRQMSNSSAPGTRQLVYATLVQARHGAPRFEELASRRQLVHARHGAHCARALRVVALDVVAVSVFPEVKPTQQANHDRSKEQQKTPSSRPKTCDASQPVESQPLTGAGGGARPQSPATAGQSRMPTGTATASDRRRWWRSTTTATRRCRRSAAAGAKPVEQQRESSRHRRGKRKPAVGTAWLDALAARRGATGQPRAPATLSKKTRHNGSLPGGTAGGGGGERERGAGTTVQRDSSDDDDDTHRTRSPATGLQHGVLP